MLDLFTPDAIAENLFPYAKRLSKAFAVRFPHVDAAEIESGAMLGLAHTVRTYDPTKGPLYPYARQRITAYILKATRAETGYREKQHAPAKLEQTRDAHERSKQIRSAVDIDITTGGPNSCSNHAAPRTRQVAWNGNHVAPICDAANVEDDVVALEVLRGIVEATRKVSPQDLAALSRVNAGKSQRAVARELGVSQPTIAKSLNRAREIIRRELEAADLLDAAA